MKYVTLKTVTIPGVAAKLLEADPTADKFDYREEILTVLSITMEREHIDPAEMRRRIRILDVIEPAKPGDTVGLEDQDFLLLSQLLDKPIYKRFTRWILAFIDDVQGSPVIKPITADDLRDEPSNGQVAYPVGVEG